MSNSKLILCLMVALGAITFSCKQVDGDKDKGRDGNADLPETTGNTGLPNGDGTGSACFGFVEDVQPLLQQHCVSCHAPGAESPQVDLTSFEGANQHAERSVARAVTQGDMPPPNRGLPPFPDTAKSTLQGWVTSGKLQSKAECPTPGGATGGFTGTGTDGGTTGTTGTTTGGTTGDMGDAFGTDEDVNYATELWLAMRRANLVGPGSAKGLPVAGAEPHGAVVSVSWGEVTVNSHTDNVFIKHNYGPAGTTPADILANPERAPAAITVTFKREANYDPSVGNMFFVKYLADGSIDQNPEGTPLAGRVGKGGDSGCVPCHSNAAGGDYAFWND